MRIIDYFDNGAKYYPDNVAFIDIDGGGDSMTYAQSLPVTHRYAAAMHANGYGQGTHVGILAPNPGLAPLLKRVNLSLDKARPDLPGVDVRAKTGTLNSVISLSGFVLGPRPDQTIAFSFLLNGVAGKQWKARALSDDLIRAIAAELYKAQE